MDGKRNRDYPESLLQWIWGNLQFNCTQLKTTAGQELSIVTPGRHNSGAGPDFKHAELIIDGIRWYGHVEIHIHGEEWNQHGHQNDPAYAGVILHVVLQGSHISVQTTSEKVPHTLELESYLQSSLAKLLKARHSTSLPCSGSITYLSQQAFEKQIQSVHREYFEYKLDELLTLYDPHLPPGQSWKQCLTGQLYRTMGIPGNKQSMDQLHKRVSAVSNSFTDLDSCVGHVQKAAFKDVPSIEWKTDGMRPAGRPEHRIVQAAALQFAVARMSLSCFLKPEGSSWDFLVQSVPKRFLPGKQRLDILEHTVFLPALYLLGKLFHDRNLMSRSFELWQSSMPQMPSEVIKPFREAGFRISKSCPQGGLVHQYKRYCSKRRCHHCEVFYTAIRS
jgi:hypothetical protein